MKTPIELPPWLQDEPDDEDDEGSGDAMLATLYRLAERSKQMKGD